MQVAGQYIAAGRAVRPARQAADERAAGKLWDVSAQLTGTATHTLLQ